MGRELSPAAMECAEVKAGKAVRTVLRERETVYGIADCGQATFGSVDRWATILRDGDTARTR